MIERIRGRLDERGDDSLVIDLGAICLRVQASKTTVANVGQVGDPVTLYSYLYLREDAVALYGFSSLAERELFEKLLSVTGVGPRAAQAVLSVLSPTALREAIEGESVDALVRVPGVGRKTAQRIILELKGKLVPLGTSPRGPALAPVDGDLVSVMMGLGYSAAEANEALRGVMNLEGLSDEDRLRAALRHFATP
jgi:Holliday junction DNA helicase RuvA